VSQRTAELVGVDLAVRVNIERFEHLLPLLQDSNVRREGVLLETLTVMHFHRDSNCAQCLGLEPLENRRAYLLEANYSAAINFLFPNSIRRHP
jgi:hypothetical protein